jgi:hypothetical protein
VTIDELFSWLDETAAYQAKSRSSSREAKDKPTDEKPNAGEPIPGSSIDALGYCYGIATHLVGLCEALMALPEIASPIANPLR